ncbi:hypothetical protein ARSEF4850_008218 [Beauveria asiatica]
MNYLEYIAEELMRDASPLTTDRGLSIQLVDYSPFRPLIYWELDPPLDYNRVRSIVAYMPLAPGGDAKIDPRRDLSDLFNDFGSMRSLEELWLEAYSFRKIKSHASITLEEAHNLQFVLSNLAAACRRLHYVKIGKLTWRIHPKVQHTKQQVCTFEEIDAWEAAAEGPAAFLGPRL